MSSKKPIPIRRKAREWTLRILYQWDIRNDDLTDTAISDFRGQVENLETDLGPRELNKVLKITLQTYRGVLTNLERIDHVLVECSHNWRLKRMAPVDRNIMRIAVYEILFQNDIPAAVSMNEAIEIAKAYGSEDSGRFVNGILDKVGKEPRLLQQFEM